MFHFAQSDTFFVFIFFLLSNNQINSNIKNKLAIRIACEDRIEATIGGNTYIHSTANGSFFLWDNKFKQLKVTAISNATCAYGASSASTGMSTGNVYDISALKTLCIRCSTPAKTGSSTFYETVTGYVDVELI